MMSIHEWFFVRLSVVFYTTAVTAATGSSIDVTIKMQHVPRIGCVSKCNKEQKKKG